MHNDGIKEIVWTMGKGLKIDWIDLFVRQRDMGMIRLNEQNRTPMTWASYTLKCWAEYILPIQIV